MMNCLHWHCLLLLLLHCSIPQIAQFGFAVKQKQNTKNIPSMPIDCKEFSVENSTENIQFPFPSPAEIIVPFSHSLFAPLHVRIQFPSNDENRTFVHVKNDRILCEYEARLEFKAFQQMPRPRQSIHNGIATDQNDVLSNETAVKLQTGNDGEHFVRFGCSNFVQPGFYRVLLLLKRNDSIEHKSTWIEVNETNAMQRPSLKLMNEHIFPGCERELSIGWSLPSCDGILQRLHFRIRLFATESEQTSLESVQWQQQQQQQQFGYIEEYPINPKADGNTTNGVLQLACAQFDIIHKQFCFELVSVNARTQGFELWDHRCVFTEAENRRRELLLRHDVKRKSSGVWDEWSRWTECASSSTRRQNSARCRPNARAHQQFGFKKRSRKCVSSNSFNNSKANILPLSHCSTGMAMERQRCHVPAPCKSGADPPHLMMASNEKDLTVTANSEDPAQNSSTAGQGCACGCNISLSPSTNAQTSTVFKSKSRHGMFFIGLPHCSMRALLRWNFVAGTRKRPLLIRLLITRRGIHPVETEHLKIVRYPQNEVIWTSDDQQLLGSFDWKKSWLTNSDFLLETMAIIEETIEEGAIGIEYLRFVDDNRHNPDNKDVPSGGFYIDYHLEPLKDFDLWASKFARVDEEFLLLDFFASAFNCSPIKSVFCKVFSTAICVLLVLATIAIPPLLCTMLTKRYMKQNLRGSVRKCTSNRFSNQKTLKCASIMSGNNTNRPELVNMANSENTEITTVGICSSGEYNAAIGAGGAQQQNEGRNVVEKRSVGVQLSGQSTPQSWSLSRAGFNRRKHSRERQQLNSSASLASTNEPGECGYFLEDDYIGPTLANSQFTPSRAAEIDIDKIISQETSGWLPTQIAVERGENLNKNYPI